MSEGDQVLNCWDDKLAIRRGNRAVDIFQIRLENNIPTLSQDVWRITYGNHTVKLEVAEKAEVRTVPEKPTSPVTNNGCTHLSPRESCDDADFEITIRPRKG